MRWRSCDSRGCASFRGQPRLAGQNDLQQLGVVRLEIGKHAHGFEDRVIEILRFVHDQEKAFPASNSFKQDLVQFAVHGDESHSLDINAQVLKDVLDEFARGALGLEKEHGARAVAQIFQEADRAGWFCPFPVRRLTRGNPRLSAIPRERDVERLAVGLAGIEVRRVGSHPEWLFRKPKNSKKHGV